MDNDANMVGNVNVVGRSWRFSVTDVICDAGKVFREMWKNIHTNEKNVISSYLDTSSDIYQRDSIDEKVEGNL